MSIGDKIKNRRIELNMSQEDLAIKVGYKSRSTINKIELGINDITQSKIKSIAKALQVTPSYLISDDLIKPKGIKIPVLGKVAGGIPIEAIQDIEDYEEITEDMAKKGEYFALKIKGHSMEPRICDGDVVIVEKQNYIEDGQIAIVMVNGNDATCKKIKHSDKGMTLISLNPIYGPMFFTCEEVENLPIVIIGRVVELRGKF